MRPTGELAQLVEPEAMASAPGFDNFYYPWCPSGVLGVPRNYRVRYKTIFPSVDLEVYSTPAGIRMAIVCAPGFDANDLYFEFAGQDSLRVDVEGELRLHMSGRYLKFPQAVAYQLDQNNQITELPWGGEWDQVGSTGVAKINFGMFDTTRTVVLQVGPPPGAGGSGPENLNDGLDWSTSFGAHAEGDPFGDHMGGSVAGPDGDLFVTLGHRLGSFPPVPGWVIQDDNWDVCVGRYDYAPDDADDDAEQKYMTHFGGTGDDKPKALFLNGAGDALYVGGFVKSTDLNPYPPDDPADDTYWEDTRKGNSDGLLVRLDPANGDIQRKAYFGGGGDDVITCFTEDDAGNIWFSGVTSSTTGQVNSCNSPEAAFPLCDAVFADNYWQSSNAGGWDAFITRLDADFEMTFSTFFGGPGDEVAYDMAYRGGSIPALRRIALVGRSLGTIPQNTLGSFHMNGIADEKSGFIATFDFYGGLAWSANMQKLHSLQSVALRASKFVVLGYSHSYHSVAKNNDGAEGEGSPVYIGCTAEPGYVSICDPGGNAYNDEVAGVTGDVYIAEVDPIQGTLDWSSFLGDFAEEFPALWALRLGDASLESPFRVRKFEDLKVDSEGNIYAMATTVKLPVEDVTYPTLPAPPFYYKEVDNTVGDDQSDVTLHIFRPDRSLFYSTLFGAFEPHVDDPLWDWIYIQFGCDVGCELALVEGEALYWTGTTGNNRFPTQCPFDGVSYCEPFIEYNGKLVQGFATRMSLQDISIGLNDHENVPTAGVAVFPSPASEHVRLYYQGLPLLSGSLRISDALGRLVLTRRIDGPLIQVHGLADGLYHARILNEAGRPLGVVPFVVQR